MNEDLRLTATRGIAWIGVAQCLRGLAQIGIFAILAHTLPPEDFGLFAMLAFLVDLFAVVVGLGIGPVIVNRKELDDAELSALFWLVVGIGAVLAVMTVTLAPLVSAFYGEARLDSLTKLLALSFVLGSVGTVPMGLLEKRLAFSRIALVETLSVLLAGLISIKLASDGWRAASLVFLPVGSLGLRSIFALVVAGWKPRFSFGLVHLRRVVEFGLSFMGHKLLYCLVRHADNFLVGLYLGATALGYYALAYRFTIFPLLLVVGMVGRVMFPILSSIQNESKRVREGYLRTMLGLASVVLPSLGGLFVLAPDILTFFLGDRWQALIPLVRVFCVAGAFQTAVATTEIVFLSAGRPGLLLALGTATFPIAVVPLGLGLIWGLQGVAIGFMASSVALWVPYQIVANGLLGLPASRLLRALKGPACAMVAAGMGMALGGKLFEMSGIGVIPRLALELVAGGFISVMVLFATRTPELADVMVAWREALRGQSVPGCLRLGGRDLGSREGGVRR